MESRKTSVIRRLNGNIAAFVVLSLMMSASAYANTHDEIKTQNIHGPWLEQKKSKVAVWIENCGDQLCGHVYWLKKPLNDQGLPKRDPNNINPDLRERLLCGLTLLTGFTPDEENSWHEGKIYNPSNGQTYKSTISLAEDGSLDIRGYVGISLFGKTSTWIRPQEQLQSCTEQLSD